jgi:hypothetical protein
MGRVLGWAVAVGCGMLAGCGGTTVVAGDTGGGGGTGGAGTGTGGASGVDMDGAAPDQDAGAVFVVPADHPATKIVFEERPQPANEALSVWGGWTDGTVVYDYATYKAIDPQYDPLVQPYREPWGAQAIPAVAVNVTNPSAPGYDGDLAALKSTVGITYLVADVHAKGMGPTTAGWLSYDVNGTGEDLSAFADGGVVFLAKAGDDPSAAQSLGLNFSSLDFYPWRDPTNPPPGAHCEYAGAAPCYDYPTITVMLGPKWTQFIVPFGSFHQKGTGLPVPDFFDARGLAQSATVGFSLPVQAKVDFWVAAFGFYKAKDYPFAD